MKRLLLALIALGGVVSVQAQDSTTKEKADTIRVGGMIIIKEKKDNEGQKKEPNVVISNHHKRKSSNLSTNWFVLDFGFSNFTDNTNYPAAIASGFLGQGVTPDQFDLRTGKSVNVNIWFFMQKFNMVKHVLNLKYGLGLELNNYRFEDERLHIAKNPTHIYIDPDWNVVDKNKLATDYVTVPLMLNFNFTPGRENGFGLSVGASAGFLYSSRQKIKVDGDKDKTKDDFDLEQWKFSYIGELNLGPVKLYGSYAMHNMWEKGLDLKPYNVGIRFSY